MSLRLLTLPSFLSCALAIPLLGNCQHQPDHAMEREAAPANADQARPSPYIHVAEVTAGDSLGSRLIPAKVAFDEDHTSRVGSPLSGRVERLLVKQGDVVSKGQPLLTVVSPEVESALAEARAAEADLSVAARSVERARGLFAERAVAHKDVLQAEGDLAKATAAAERSQARMALLGIRADEHTSRFTLRAPIAGTVVERSILPGSEVRADSGIPLLTISSLDTVWVVAEVYESNLAAVQVGDEASVQVVAYSGETFVGKVAYVADTVDPQSRTVKIRLVADNRARKLKPEMFARVALRAAVAKGLSVPSSAVLAEGDSNVVILALGNGRYEKRRVEIGDQEGGRIAVLSGLNLGERIVAAGAVFVNADLEARQ